MAKIAVYTFLPLDNYGGTERVLSQVGYLLQRNGHHYRIVSLLRKGLARQKLIDWLSSLPVEFYSIPKTARPERVHWFLRMLKRKSLISATAAILEDFEKNGIPDYCLVATYFEIIPDLAQIRKIHNLGFKIVYWDHFILPGLKGLMEYTNPLDLYRFLSLKLYHLAAGYALRMADFHLAISTGIKKLILGYDPSANVKVIYNPVLVSQNKLAKRSSFPTFLYVGRLEDFQKNISFLLRGFSKLDHQEWVLKIIGTGPDEENLKRLAVQLGIDNKIQWLGFRNDPFDSIEECTALLLTSRFEGFGLVLIEANAHGIPVISSNCLAGPEDIVIEGVNGYLFPEGDLEAFVNILRKVIRGELNFASPEEIARTAERFSPDAFYERFKGALGL
jgi:UDP-D-galactose:(glucosyl)LPS alpha-1,6-D-galactosyltransferase